MFDRARNANARCLRGVHSYCTLSRLYWSIQAKGCSTCDLFPFCLLEERHFRLMMRGEKPFLYAAFRFATESYPLSAKTSIRRRLIKIEDNMGVKSLKSDTLVASLWMLCTIPFASASMDILSPFLPLSTGLLPRPCLPYAFLT